MNRKAAHTTVTAICLLGLAAAATAQDARSWLNPRLGHRKAELTYSFRSHCDRDVEYQNRGLGMDQYRLDVNAPVYQDERQEWVLSAGYGGWDIDTDAVLPDTGDGFPTCLHDVRVGASYRTKLDNDWIWGAGAYVGSPSDDPFHSGDEVSVSARGFVRIPHGERNAFLVFLAFSNVRDFAQYIPLPGAAYHWRPTDRLSILAGAPVSSVQWRPTDKLTITGRYMLLRNIHARIGYEVVDNCEIYGLFEWDNDEFFRYDRPDDDDRLHHYEKRLGGGVKINLTDDLTLDLSAGWAFDRMWFEGEDFDERGQNRLDLDDGLYVGAVVSFRF